MNDPRLLVAHVVYRFDIGGLENGVVSLVNHLPQDRYRHAIISLTEITDFKRRVRHDDVTFIELKKSPGPGIKIAPRLFRLFRNLRPNVVHTNNLAALELTMPAWFAGVKACVHTEHGWNMSDLQGTQRRNLWTRRIYRPFVGHYAAVSQQLFDFLLQDVGFKPSAVSLVYNGVDVSRFEPKGTKESELPGCPFDPQSHWLIGTVGRMDVIKDQVTLARAFAIAVRSSSEAREKLRLVFVGDGPMRTEVERVLQDNGIADLVWMAGARNDIPEILQRLDAFALPSLAEGVPYTLLEAMATSLPIVASKVGGMLELIENGVNGILLPPGNPENWAKAILRLFESPSEGSRMGKAARLAAEQKYSLDLMVQTYDRLYLKLLGR